MLVDFLNHGCGRRTVDVIALRENLTAAAHAHELRANYFGALSFLRVHVQRKHGGGNSHERGKNQSETAARICAPSETATRKPMRFFLWSVKHYLSGAAIWRTWTRARAALHRCRMQVNLLSRETIPSRPGDSGAAPESFPERRLGRRAKSILRVDSGRRESQEDWCPDCARHTRRRDLI